MKNKSTGLTFSINDFEICIHLGDTIVTQKGTVAEKYKSTVLSLENGQKLEGYVKVIGDGYMPDFEFYPKEFKKAITVLSYLGVNSTLIDEEPKKKTKGKFVKVKLAPEQENKLNQLKALCH